LGGGMVCLYGIQLCQDNLSNFITFTKGHIKSIACFLHARKRSLNLIRDVDINCPEQNPTKSAVYHIETECETLSQLREDMPQSPEEVKMEQLAAQPQVILFDCVSYKYVKPMFMLTIVF